MKNLLSKTLVASMLVSSASTAFAGGTQPFPINIDFEEKIAQGDMVTARFSDNDLDLIGCGTRYQRSDDGEMFAFGFCQATAATGEVTEEGEPGVESIRCFTQEPLLIEAMNSISDFSFISFNWEEISVETETGTETQNECSAMGVSTQSFYIPELKSDLSSLEIRTKKLETKAANLTTRVRKLEIKNRVPFAR